MGINIILPLIIGMALMVSLGSQVVPSFVEQMKIAKVENRTIANQKLIKDAIVRYIKIKGELPVAKKPPLNPLKDLEDAGLIQAHHKENLFSGGYSFDIDKKKGILKIFTTINDENAGKYFSNSFKFPNKPYCFKTIKNIVNGVSVESCENNLWETFYLLDDDTFKSIPTPKPPELGSKQDILDRFTEDNIGKKKDKDGKEIVFNVGDKDYVVNPDTNNVTEYEKQPDGTWDKGKTIIVPSLDNKEHGIRIVNLSWEFVDGKNNLIKNTYEKIFCGRQDDNKYLKSNIEKKEIKTESDIKNEALGLIKGQLPIYDNSFFVVNENTNLGEIVWVPNTTVSNLLEPKISNNTCVSNTNTNMRLYSIIPTSDYKIDRWDTSRLEKFEVNINNKINNSFDLKLLDTSWVINLSSLFYGNDIYNKNLNFDVSNVTNMPNMFYKAGNFNQPLDYWNTSQVISMHALFTDAKKFNQDISNWNVSNVMHMNYMFQGAILFNQDLSKWCVSKITTKPNSFDSSTPAWTNPAYKPKWGKAKVIETKTINGKPVNSKCQIEQSDTTCKIYDLLDNNKEISSNTTCQ